MTRALTVASLVLGLLGLLGLTGCSTLDDLGRDVCGNGIVERGEDCDSSVGCVACSIQCTSTAACVAFDANGGTAGFVCGADGFCHAPAGTFHAPSELAVAADTVRVADVDRDQIGDLLIQSPTALHVSRGNPDGTASLDTSILTPIARGPASYADLDLDGTRDLVLPTSDGIVAYTSEFGVMAPFPFPSRIGQSMGDPLFAHRLDEASIGFVGTQGATDELLYLALRVDTGGGQPQPLAPVCGAKAAQFTASQIDVVEVAPGHHVVAVTLDPPRVCLLELDRQPDLSYTATPIAAPAAAPSGRAVLARLRTGACPSLVMRTATGLVEHRPSAAIPPCSVALAPSALDAEGAPIGWMPLVPRVAGADFALVLSTGVYAYASGALQPVYRADRALALVRAADLDGDGDGDLVAGARDAATGAPLEDLDILYRAPGGMPDGFVRYRFDTAGPVLAAQLGDYDGNGLLDVAYVERRARRGVTSEDLAIAYGTRDRLLPGVGAGSFEHVISLVNGDIPDSNDQSNLVTDCVVLFDSAGEKQVSLLHGSPQRTLLGYFDPRPPPTGQPRTSVFRGAVGGRFRSAAGAGLDIVATEAVDGVAHSSALWISEGPTGGSVQLLDPVAAPDLVRCDVAPATGDQFCLDDARYVAWPALDGTDRVIGLDPRGNALTFHASNVDATRTMRAQRWPAGALAIPAGARVHRVDVATLDDGPHLVVAYAAASHRAVALCDVDGAGQATACTDLGALISQQVPGDTWTCSDAAAGRVAPFQRFDTVVPPTAIVALCQGRGAFATLFHVTGGAATRLLEILPAEELHVGDVSGDGIDDLITIGRSSAIPVLRIYTQCTSRDRCDVNTAVEVQP